MRRISIILLCLLLSGCSTDWPEIPPYTTSQASHTIWEPIRFAELPECSFRVENWEINPEGEYSFELVCHNRSDVPQLFSCEGWCIDGWQVLPFWGEEVPPGEEATFSVLVPNARGKDNQTQLARNIAFDLRIFSQADLWQNYLVCSHCSFSATGEKNTPIRPEPLAWQEDAKVLVDNSGCTIVLTGVRQTQGRYEVDCLLENKTRSNMMFRLFDPAFNGVETDQVWTLQLTAGAKCAQTIVFDLPQTAGYMRWLELEVQTFNIDEWFGKVWAQEEFCIRVSDLL